MNKTKIEWCDYTWNPVTGCKHSCDYCYARRLAYRFTPKASLGDDCTQPGKGLHEIRYKAYGGQWRYGFEPTLHSYRIGEPVRIKKPSKIFVCSMADLFGDWVPKTWIWYIYRTASTNPQHTFQFLTKNPKRYQEFNPWPDNCWLGTTITNQEDADKRLPELLQAKAKVRFISAEPLLGKVNLSKAWWGKEGDPFYPWCGSIVNTWLHWLIIGAMTGAGAVKPEYEWVLGLYEQAQSAHVPIFIKNNVPYDLKIQEYPQ